MFRNVLLTLAAMTFSVTVFAAQDEKPKPTEGGKENKPCLDCGYESFDLHNNNRAVAFGSLLIQAVAPDLTTWLAINATDYCKEPWSFPEGKTKDAGDGNDRNDGNDGDDSIKFTCWAVDVTMAYELSVCPDGSASILRSGVGVALENRSTGETYSWTEVASCDDGGIELNGKTAKSKLDRSRPLDHKHITRRPL